MRAKEHAKEQPEKDAAQRRVPNSQRQAGAGGQPAVGTLSPQTVATLQRTAGNAAVARMLQRSAVHGVLRSAGKPLDEPLRTEMESRLGTDFSDVRVHSDTAAQRSAAEVGARAYTSGSHVVLGKGGADKHTLAHELTHVIQQRQGRVAGTDNGSGLKISDPGDRFERAAEANAVRVMRAPAPARADGAAASPGNGSAAAVGTSVQRAYTGTHFISYGAVHPSAGTGTSMRAELHPGQIPRGSSPSVKPSWWPKAGTPTGDWFRAYMVQGHLLNDNVGGPGNTLQNLTPLTKTGNSNHHAQAEKNVKKEIANGNIVEYDVKAKYGKVSGAGLGAPANVAPDIDANYADKIPLTLEADVTVYDAQGNRMYGEGWIVHNEKY